LEAELPQLDEVLPADDSTGPMAVPPVRHRQWWRVAREVLLTAAFSVLLLIGTRTVAQGREVFGPSMQPTFQQGQRVAIGKYLFGGPGRGDVIVFHPPAPTKDEYIKRVIGLPGDHVQVQGGQVSVNGVPLNEPYLHQVVTTCAGPRCDITLGADQYYVMGDNRPNSSDSRAWGPVAGDRISGKAWLRFFPFTDFRTSF
jgi:signal peptidase I